MEPTTPVRRHGWFGRLLSRMFNLNDPRWGRDGSGKESPLAPQDPKGSSEPPKGSRPPNSPPDLDEVWKDLSQKLAKLLGKKYELPPKNGRRGGYDNDNKGAGRMITLVVGVILLFWLGSGFFTVQEGQQAVITRFGQYQHTVGAGFNWHLPWPIDRDEIVSVSQIRSVDVGTDELNKSSGLRDAALLTRDENILEVKFAVQYRLNNARDWLFSTKDPEGTVVEAAKSSIRQVLGSMKMDQALADDRDQIAPRVKTIMQKILDGYHLGVDVVTINLRHGGVRPPEQVQSAFDDVLKAEQEKERSKNEAEAYANNVIPRAKGTAARLLEEAKGYEARVVAQAHGDAKRFDAILTEYQKAPQVTKDRMYLETMQKIYADATKVMVDGKQSNNLLYLPLDKLLKTEKAQPSITAPTPRTNSTQPVAPAASTVTPSHAGVPRSEGSLHDSAWDSDSVSRERDRDFR